MAEFDAATDAAVAAAREADLQSGDGRRVVFGFDGYVDRVREVVADRQDPDTYERLDELAGFGERVRDSVAAGSSLSFEWFQRGTRTGGHTSHLARAFDGWGFAPTMIGMYGRPELSVFASEFDDCERFSLGEPGYTDAVEFDDGKLMLIENGDTTALDWGRLCEVLGRERLVDRLDGTDLLGVGYWAETPDLPDVLAGLRDCWDEVSDPPDTVVVDPGDVRKLDADRLAAGRAALAGLDDVARVVLTANRAETRELAAAWREAGDDASAEADADEDRPPVGEDQAGDARRVADALDVSLVVSHGIERSVVVAGGDPDDTGGDGDATAVAVPRIDDPELTTSAGDHFNAGLALALVSGLDPAPAVAVGNAVAGAFVRSGEPPSLDEVEAFLAEYPDLF